VLSERNFRLPPGVTVTEADPSIVRLQIAPSARPKNSGDSRQPMVTSAAHARSLVESLPEVRRLAAASWQQGFKPIVKVEASPNPLIQAGDRQVYSVLVGEDRVTRVVRLMTFEVNAMTAHISVFDEEEDAMIPLEKWRKKRR